METCGECRFSNLVIFPDGPNMQCRRYPPQLFGPSDDPLIAWPQVSSDEWCGEFKLDEQRKATKYYSQLRESEKGDG